MHFFYIILSEESFEDFLRKLSLQNNYILSLCFGKSIHHRNEVIKLHPHDTNNPDLSKDLSRREMQNSHCLLGLVSMGFPAKWSLFLCHLPSLFPRTVSLTMKPPLQMWSHLVTKNQCDRTLTDFWVRLVFSFGLRIQVPQMIYSSLLFLYCYVPDFLLWLWSIAVWFLGSYSSSRKVIFDICIYTEARPFHLFFVCVL